MYVFYFYVVFATFVWFCLFDFYVSVVLMLNYISILYIIL